MKRKLFLYPILLSFGLFSTDIFAQTDTTGSATEQQLLNGEEESPKNIDAQDKPSFRDRLFFGGNFGLQFGSITNIDISPLVGYRITPRFSAGLGITYQYIRYNDFDYNTSVYGGRVFSRFIVTGPNAPTNVFIHAEYEMLNGDVINPNTLLIEKDWVPGAFAGLGFIQGIGGRAAFGLTVLYNFLYDPERSFYGSPWVVRAGFTF